MAVRIPGFATTASTDRDTTSMAAPLAIRRFDTISLRPPLAIAPPRRWSRSSAPRPPGSS
jgi:hypothetical protein